MDCRAVHNVLIMADDAIDQAVLDQRFNTVVLTGDLPTRFATLGLALAGFNIGVEIGQVIIVTVFVPILVLTDRLADKTWLSRTTLVRISSAIIAGLGFYWLITRLNDIRSPVAPRKRTVHLSAAYCACDIDCNTLSTLNYESRVNDDPLWKSVIF